MREIIYIQAGTTSNYIGTHFWNLQEHYVNLEQGASANDHAEELINHAISWTQRQNPEKVAFHRSLSHVRSRY